MRRPTLQHRLEYLGFRALVGTARVLPEAAALGLGERLGSLAAAALPSRRRVVDANLALAFPERSPAWRAEVARASWRHLGRESVATFRLGAASRADAMARTEVYGMEALREAVASGRGAILVGGHIGNWEAGGAALAARGVAVEGVAFRQGNPLFEEDLVRNRARLGIQVVYRVDAPRAAVRAVREGRVPALVADQDARGSGIFVDFMGVPASTARGPAVFALRTGARLFLGSALARPGVPGWDLHLDPVDVEPTGDLEADVRRLTEAHTRALERWVREVPEQYFWQHKRWRTRPPEEGAEGPGSQEPGLPSPV